MMDFGGWQQGNGTYFQKKILGVPVVFWRNCLGIRPCLQDGISEWNGNVQSWNSDRPRSCLPFDFHETVPVKKLCVSDTVSSLECEL